MAAKESRMRGCELAEGMVVVINCLVNVRESAGGLDKAIETIGTSYLEACKAKMLMRDIPKKGD